MSAFRSFLLGFLFVLGLGSCVPIDPYYDGGGYSPAPYGGSYGGGGYYGDSYYSRPATRPYYSGSYARVCPICHRSNCSGHHHSSSRYDGHDHHDHDRDDHRRKPEKNDTLYKYRGKSGPQGNHTIDWWHSRGYQRSQLDFAD